MIFYHIPFNYIFLISGFYLNSNEIFHLQRWKGFSRVSIKTRLKFPRGLSKMRKKQNFHIIFQWYQSKKSRISWESRILLGNQLLFAKDINSEKVCPSPVWLKNGIAQYETIIPQLYKGVILLWKIHTSMFGLWIFLNLFFYSLSYMPLPDKDFGWTKEGNEKWKEIFTIQ